MADAHAHGLAVHCWTFRDEDRFRPAGLDAAAELRAFFDAGVDGVFADQPRHRRGRAAVVDDEAVNEIDEERARKARAHLFSGVAAFVVAVIAVPVFGWLAGAGDGDLRRSAPCWRRRTVRRDGEVAPAARALMIVGGLGFAAVCVLLAVRAFSR